MYKLLLTIYLTTAVLPQDLITVVVIYRHGDRTPVVPYKTDPYKYPEYWPVGFQQLTNLGKQQQYQLGKWLRERYRGFLPLRYSEKDVYVLSTDVDRTLMSAAVNLAGLYPPVGDQIWNTEVPWQPVPIHTVPLPEDNLLGMSKRCPKYEQLNKELFESEHFVNISRENQDLFDEILENSGTIVTFKTLQLLYDTLYIESLYGFPLPNWTKPFFPDRIKPLVCSLYGTTCYTPELARLQTGPLFHRILQHFQNATTNEDFYKLLVFSGHEVTIANVLKTLSVFDDHCPPYDSTIMMELRHGSSYYVNIFYKNSSLYNISLGNCGFDCDLEEFAAILEPIAITREQRDEECEVVSYLRVPWEYVSYVIALVAVLAVLVFVLSVGLVWMWCRRNEMKAEINKK